MNKQTNDIFSRRLRQARMMKGFSLEKLSQCVTPAITRQAINKYEKGLMMPDSRVLIALAAALGVKIDYFSVRSPWRLTVWNFVRNRNSLNAWQWL